MAWVVHAGLLMLASSALFAAGLRAAAAAGASGLERPIAAAPCAVAAAAAAALALGVVGLGSSPLALTVAAIATWAGARRAFPAPANPGAHELAIWWGRLGAGVRAATTAVACAVLAWAAWLIVYPHVGGDGLLYHLPKVAGWVTSGEPGTLRTLFVDNPFQSFPGTNELVLAWATGIARNLAVLSLWAVPVLLLLLGASTWQAARTLGAPAGPVAVLVGAVSVGPLLATQASGPNTDLPVVAWSACTVALAIAAARGQAPALLAPAILAAGLAIGTKTTAAPLAGAAVILGLWACRRTLRPHAATLVLAAAGALLVGGVWYVRNLLDHGSPLWPFTAAPWGDAVPEALSRIDGRLLADPIAGAASRPDVYADFFAGHLVLLGAALVAPLVVRRQAVLAAAGATLGCLLVWAAAPTTGFPADPVYDLVSASAFRYSMPALIPALLALALAAREGRGGRALAVGAGLTSIAWSLVRDAQIGFPFLPGAAPVALAAAVGAAVGLLAPAVTRPARGSSLTRLAGGLALIAAAAAIAAGGPGYVDRHLDTSPQDADVLRFVTSAPGFAGGERPVAMAPHLNGILTGGSLSHPLELIGLGESCASVRRRAEEGWVMLHLTRAQGVIPELAALDTPSTRQAAALAACFRGRAPAYATLDWLVYGPGA